MAYTFRIIFRGFLAFVPKLDGGKPEQLSVLMPQSRLPRLERKGRNHIIPRHASILITDPDDVAKGDPAFCYSKEKCQCDGLNEESGKQHAVYDLSGWRVKIKASDNPSLTLRGGTGYDSVDRILPARDLCGSGRRTATPKREYLQNRDSTASLLNTAVDIDHGELYCREVDRDDGDAEVITWHWHPLSRSDSERTGPLATLVGLEMKIESGPVTFEFFEFGDADPSRAIQFKAGSDIEVAIAHSEPEKLLGLEYSKPRKTNGVTWDDDVRGFIKMTQGINFFTTWQNVWTPILGKAGGRRGICKSALFDHPDSS